jgi:hypothetical protein
MATMLPSSSPEGGYGRSDMMGGDLILKAPEFYIQQARELVVQLEAETTRLEPKMRRGDWRKIHELTWDFCKIAQIGHASVGGIQEQSFSDLIEVLSRFVVNSDVLLTLAEEIGVEIPNDTRARITGVVKRCRKRIRKLSLKKNAIASVQEALDVMTSASR